MLVIAGLNVMSEYLQGRSEHSHMYCIVVVVLLACNLDFWN